MVYAYFCGKFALYGKFYFIRMVLFFGKAQTNYNHLRRQWNKKKQGTLPKS